MRAVITEPNRPTERWADQGIARDLDPLAHAGQYDVICAVAFLAFSDLHN
jgi:hypothetical protein